MSISVCCGYGAEAGWATSTRYAGLLHSTPLDHNTRERQGFDNVASFPSSSDRYETILIRTKIQSILCGNPTLTRTHLREWAKLVNFILFRYARNRHMRLPIKIDTYRDDRIASRHFSIDDIRVKYVCTEDCVIPLEDAASRYTSMHSYATPTIESSSNAEREKCIMKNCEGLLFRYVGTRGTKDNFRPLEVVVSLSILTLLQNVYANENFRSLLWTETATLDLSESGFVYDIADTKQWYQSTSHLLINNGEFSCTCSNNKIQLFLFMVFVKGTYIADISTLCFPCSAIEYRRKWETSNGRDFMVKTPAQEETRDFNGARWRVACGLYIDATNYSDKRSGSVSPVWLIDYGVPPHLRWTKPYKCVLASYPFSIGDFFIRKHLPRKSDGQFYFVLVLQF